MPIPARVLYKKKREEKTARSINGDVSTNEERRSSLNRGLFCNSQLRVNPPRLHRQNSKSKIINNTMVKVWYEPPPGGPRTHLNRGGYYVESARTPAFMTKLSKAKPITVVVPAIAAIAALCYVPLSKYSAINTIVPLFRERSKEMQR
jgi:hypothetical protein